MRRLAFIASLAVMTCLAPYAFSDTITFTNNQYASGTGFGNVTNVLSLQETGDADGTESGFGGPEVQPGGRSTNTSNAWTGPSLQDWALRMLIWGSFSTPPSLETNHGQFGSFSLDFYDSTGALLFRPF
jgi:hypothetical protein